MRRAAHAIRPHPTTGAGSGEPRWTRRRVLGSALAVGAAWLLPSWRSARAASEPAGQLVLPRGREIGLVKADGSEDRTILSLKQGEFVADVALSPDGARVAFGLYSARPSGAEEPSGWAPAQTATIQPGGSDIVIASVENPAERTVVVPRDRPGMLLAAPRWSPDGQALVFEAVGVTATGQAGVSAEWVAADGTGRRTIAQAARYPSFSPDGTSIVCTRALPTGDALWEYPLGGGQGRQIVPESQFLLVVYPRYSPDGNLIAFAGLSDTLPPAPAVPGGPRPPAPKLLSGRLAADPFEPLTVAAHGFPSEPFVVSPSGADPRRLAPLAIDDAAIAWSPDGAWVAVSGAPGLYLVGIDDGEVRRVGENSSFGAIDWR